jgi:hypothetical protein
MRTFLLAFAASLAAGLLSHAQVPEPFVYFKQDFCETGLQFQSASPNTGQVDHLLATSPATAVLGPCYLDASRTVSSSGGSVRIVRTTPLASPAPQTLHALIDLEVSDITTEGSIAAYFGIGTNLPSNSILIPNASLFSKLSIDFNENGTFNLRISHTNAPPTLSAPLSGRIRIVWAMNNSTGPFNYYSPLKTRVALSPGQFDLWINEDKWISGASRISDVSMDNFAFILSNGVGKVRLHHLELSNNGFQLPLILTRFKAERRLNEALIYWAMAPGHTAAQFRIERSTTATAFETIGSVEVKDSEELRYQFSDRSPKVGHNYYRLKMVGIDGEVKYSSVSQIQFDPSEPVLTLAPNPASPDQITLLAIGVEPENIRVHSLLGRSVSFSHRYDKESSQLAILPSAPLPSGIYLVSLGRGSALKSIKVVIP